MSISCIVVPSAGLTLIIPGISKDVRRRFKGVVFSSYSLVGRQINISQASVIVVHRHWLFSFFAINVSSWTP